LLVKVEATDITANTLTLTINGFHFARANHLLKSTGTLKTPKNAHVLDSNAKAYSLKPTWSKLSNADYYEIYFNGQLHTNIKDTTLLFDDLIPETNYSF